MNTTPQIAPWHVNLMTLFPEMFPGPLGQSLSGRALDKKIWSWNAVNIRDFATDNHKTVDDTPFGGGAGMVMRADILERAFLSIPNPGKRIYMSPRGRVLNQRMAEDFITAPSLTILCGRYEGVDQRFLDAYDFDEVSIGDYVLSGGEPAAMILMDACIRLLPGVMGNVDTAGEESFAESTGGLLEYPHYTRPATWTTTDGRALDVPDILTSGNHGKVAQWRRDQALALTRERRPDLLKK
ncbi:tRNA (guanosine(37)-N1)-methyltransferase TrmD [Micavibrio aeruginosavorus]|uniref:tRNA (guanosine(37)-N1)-methyltransferase TrmD n=1 Tax=Micavibrio aeruginosavorus TaxID=349221 RepID=UPI003F4A910D